MGGGGGGGGQKKEGVANPQLTHNLTAGGSPNKESWGLPKDRLLSSNFSALRRRELSPPSLKGHTAKLKSWIPTVLPLLSSNCPVFC